MVVSEKTKHLLDTRDLLAVIFMTLPVIFCVLLNHGNDSFSAPAKIGLLLEAADNDTDKYIP